MSNKKTNGLLRSAIAENPLLVLFLGACPAMAQTTSVIAALGMGVAVLAVMLLSGIVISALRKAVPECAKLPVYIIVVAGFVSIVQLLMNAFLPNVYQMLGVYIVVAAVDLMIFGEAEAAGKGSIGASVKNSLVTGISFIFVLFVMAAVREVFGSASFAGIDIPFLANYKITLLAKAPGGFLVFSIMTAVINAIRPVTDKAACQCMACTAAGVAPVSCENLTQGE